MRLLECIKNPKSFPLTTEERELLEQICKSCNPIIELGGHDDIPRVCVGNPKIMPGRLWTAVDVDVVRSLRKRKLLTVGTLVQPSNYIIYRLNLPAFKQYPELSELRTQIALGLTLLGETLDEEN